MSLNEKIDTTIWHKINTKDNGFLQINIYSHKGNYDNNGDKFLVVLSSDGGNSFMGLLGMNDDVSLVNDNDYNLLKLDGIDEFMFVICGPGELQGFIESAGFVD